MKRIGEDVSRELGRFGSAAGMARIVEAWPAAVGPTVARNAWPARIARDGTLHVATSSSAWAFELAQLDAQILGRLRAEASDAAPRALRFAVGRLPELGGEQERPGVRDAVVPGPREHAAAAELAAPIEDASLRDLVAKAAAHGLTKAGSDRSV